MALINCKECGAKISSSSKSCIKCGSTIHNPSFFESSYFRFILFLCLFFYYLPEYGPDLREITAFGLAWIFTWILNKALYSKSPFFGPGICYNDDCDNFCKEIDNYKRRCKHCGKGISFIDWVYSIEFIVIPVAMILTMPFFYITDENIIFTILCVIGGSLVLCELVPSLIYIIKNNNNNR